MSETLQPIKPTQNKYEDKSEWKIKPKYFCPKDQREITVEVDLCPVFVCFDGLLDEEFCIEKFYGCGHGTGSIPWRTCAGQAVINKDTPSFLFTMPGRYRIVLKGDEPCDRDRVEYMEQDVSFEFAKLYLMQTQGGCC